MKVRQIRRLADWLTLRAVDLWGWVRHPRAMFFCLRHSWPRGRLACLGQPRTVNEKFLWRKLFDHDPRFTTLCDKVAAKHWVHRTFPEIDTAPVLWVGEDPADLPPELLQGAVIVKASHGCGTNRVVTGGDGPPADLIAEARGWLALDHGRRRREWGYQDVPRRILVEALMSDGTDPVQDLKYYCFGGRITRLVQIVGRSTGRMSARIHEPLPDAADDPTLYRTTLPAEVTPDLYTGSLPATAVRAEALARRIGAGFDHVRIDFLTNGDALWLGEMTLYNQGGRMARGGGDPQHPATLAWDLRQSLFLRQPPVSGWRAVYARALRRSLDHAALADATRSGRGPASALETSG
jgi:hypothetical protein